MGADRGRVYPADVRKVLIAMLAGGLMAIAVPVQAAPAPATAAPAPASAPAAPLDPLAAQLQEQAALNATITSLDNELQSARDSQASLRVLVTANQAAIAQTLTQLSAAEQTYSDASARAATEKAAAATARHNARIDKELLGLYLRLGYETQDSLLAYLLSSDSVSELLSRAGDVAHLVHRSTDLVNQIKADVAAAESAEAAAARDAATAQQAAAQLQLQQQTLQQQTQHAKDLIAQLGSQAAATTAEINAANGQSLAVAQQIAATRITELDQTIAEAELAAWQAAEDYIQKPLGTPPPGSGTAPPCGWASAPRPPCPSPGTGHSWCGRRTAWRSARGSGRARTRSSRRSVRTPTSTPGSISPGRSARRSSRPPMASWSRPTAARWAMATTSSSPTPAACSPCTATSPRCWCTPGMWSRRDRSSACSGPPATPPGRTAISRFAPTTSRSTRVRSCQLWHGVRPGRNRAVRTPRIEWRPPCACT